MNNHTSPVIGNEVLQAQLENPTRDHPPTNLDSSAVHVHSNPKVIVYLIFYPSCFHILIKILTKTLQIFVLLPQFLKLSSHFFYRKNLKFTLKNLNQAKSKTQFNSSNSHCIGISFPFFSNIFCENNKLVK